MRVIEKEMLKALRDGRAMTKGNTKVTANGMVYLHDNHIASVFDDFVTVNVRTLRNWPTPTTKSRLRALGVDVSSKDFNTFLEGTDIWDIEADYYDTKKE